MNPLEFLIIILSRMFTLIKSPNVLGLICLLDLFAGVKKCPGGKDGTEFSLIFFRSWSLWFLLLLSRVGRLSSSSILVTHPGSLLL